MLNLLLFLSSSFCNCILSNFLPRPFKLTLFSFIISLFLVNSEGKIFIFLITFFWLIFISLSLLSFDSCDRINSLSLSLFVISSWVSITSLLGFWIPIIINSLFLVISLFLNIPLFSSFSFGSTLEAMDEVSSIFTEGVLPWISWLSSFCDCNMGDSDLVSVPFISTWFCGEIITLLFKNFEYLCSVFFNVFLVTIFISRLNSFVGMRLSSSFLLIVKDLRFSFLLFEIISFILSWTFSSLGVMTYSTDWAICNSSGLILFSLKTLLLSSTFSWFSGSWVSIFWFSWVSYSFSFSMLILSCSVSSLLIKLLSASFTLSWVSRSLISSFLSFFFLCFFPFFLFLSFFVLFSSFSFISLSTLVSSSYLVSSLSLISLTSLIVFSIVNRLLSCECGSNEDFFFLRDLMHNSFSEIISLFGPCFKSEVSVILSVITGQVFSILNSLVLLTKEITSLGLLTIVISSLIIFSNVGLSLSLSLYLSFASWIPSMLNCIQLSTFLFSFDTEVFSTVNLLLFWDSGFRIFFFFLSPLIFNSFSCTTSLFLNLWWIIFFLTTFFVEILIFLSLVDSMLSSSFFEIDEISKFCEDLRDLLSSGLFLSIKENLILSCIWGCNSLNILLWPLSYVTGATSDSFFSLFSSIFSSSTCWYSFSIISLTFFFLLKDFFLMAILSFNFSFSDGASLCESLSLSLSLFASLSLLSSSCWICDDFISSPFRSILFVLLITKLFHSLSFLILFSSNDLYCSFNLGSEKTLDSTSSSSFKLSDVILLMSISLICGLIPVIFKLFKLLFISSFLSYALGADIFFINSSNFFFKREFSWSLSL